MSNGEKVLAGNRERELSCGGNLMSKLHQIIWGLHGVAVFIALISAIERGRLSGSEQFRA